ncbi:amidohydrolase family protein [Mycolicibacterium phocaicum]|uniref:amidohydrolase family protein n=1 Tax=Mycolicibacterium phocaicum TaxID=319706 RepID=UPI001CFB6CB9|nr:amidohydrolase family protein [Mycolicibacterium phocaicum]UCZ60371.1 amidohydrolase family protein [Mycolicibacterium phocaicum]
MTTHEPQHEPALPTRAGASRTWTLNDVVLIDGTGAPAMPAAQVIIEDGVVAAIEPAAASANGPSVVPGRGRWLLPGLWDTHMHHGFSAGSMTSAAEVSRDQGLLNWRAYLRSGVTSVVSTGDDPRRIIAARAAERAGELLGPRIFAAGSVVTAPGGHPINTLMHGSGYDLGDLAVGLDEPAAAVQHVRSALLEQDLDLVKVVVSSIPGDGPRLRPEVLDAIVLETHRLGRHVIAHVSTEQEAAEAVAAGVDGLEHMVPEGADLFDATLAKMTERGVMWTPTLSLFDRMAHDRDLSYVQAQRPDGYVSPIVLQSVESWAASRTPRSPDGARWERTVDNAGRAHAAGVRLALGTDAGMTAVFHGLAVHHELELLVRAGLSPYEALTAATAVAAEKVGASARLGTVEVGKEADLVLLRADPLADIRNTRAIDLVVKRGVPYDPDALRVA